MEQIGNILDRVIGITPRDINEARTLANIARRAATLLTDGYRIKDGSVSGLFFVHSPEGGCTRRCSSRPTGFSCSCECFKKLETCKHLLAVWNHASDQAQADAYDAQQADRDWYLYDRGQEVENFCNGRFDR